MAKLKWGTHIEPVSANTVQLVDYEARTIAKIDPEKGQRFAIDKRDERNKLYGMNSKQTRPLRTVLTLPSEGNTLSRNCQTLFINPHGLEAPSEI